jgi:hypothetical protein
MARWRLGSQADRYDVKKVYSIDNIKFDSKRELNRYLELKLLERAGVITDLELQPRIRIVIGGVEVKMISRRYPNGRALTYVGDFRYLDLEKNATILEDVKMNSGHRPDVYKVKRALIHAMGLEITEV